MSISQPWQADQYQLLDFGDGRKLERFGSVVLDRPCPAAEGKRRSSAASWHAADVRIDSEGQAPSALRRGPPTDWRASFETVTFELRLTPFGHVGLFPEHVTNWRWLVERFAGASPRATGPAPRLLNLFAYTGGASLYLAGAGWQVVHVDASAPSVAWARRNAQLSSLEHSSIRWIVDDARGFVAREVRRGNRYDAILLDPPTYGHGPKGKAWQIERDLRPLLIGCIQLLSAGPAALVLTGHSDSIDGASVDLPALFAGAGRAPPAVDTGRLSLTDLSGRRLDCGWYARAVAK